MSPIQQLVQEAKAKRDAAVKQARDAYREEVRAIRAMDRKLHGWPKPKKPRKKLRRKPCPSDGPYYHLSVAKAARLILEEGRPLTLTELTVEIQARGCRAGDDPRAVVENVRSSLKYHSATFTRDAEGRWSSNNIH